MNYVVLSNHPAQNDAPLYLSGGVGRELLVSSKSSCKKKDGYSVSRCPQNSGGFPPQHADVSEWLKELVLKTSES